jgi:hypothetical protein
MGYLEISAILEGKINDLAASNPFTGNALQFSGGFSWQIRQQSSSERDQPG